MSTGPGRERLDASMTLLTEIMDRPLDPGYAAAAAAPSRPRRPTALAGLTAVACALGLVAAVAALGLRAPHPEVAHAREVLTSQISARAADGDAAAAQVGALQVEIDRLRAAGRASVADRADVSGADRAAVGAVAVTGPGLVVTLVETNGRDLVQDVDLQRVVNALWAGGAEAIAINGHRLTPLSAIRTAGSAVLVDLEPLISPYQISAIGNADAMSVAMVRTGTSDAMRLWESSYGIRSARTATSTINLPSSDDAHLYYASPLREP